MKNTRVNNVKSDKGGEIERKKVSGKAATMEEWSGGNYRSLV
jgi:hypothetical protein